MTMGKTITLKVIDETITAYRENKISWKNVAPILLASLEAHSDKQLKQDLAEAVELVKVMKGRLVEKLGKYLGKHELPPKKNIEEVYNDTVQELQAFIDKH